MAAALTGANPVEATSNKTYRAAEVMPIDCEASAKRGSSELEVQMELEPSLELTQEGLTVSRLARCHSRPGRGCLQVEAGVAALTAKTQTKAVFGIPWAPLATGPEAKTSVHEADGDQPPSVQ
ncbi:hypothetical protein CKAH01_08020 [Colletotrichum kahawae]|uniref:Uncharacterized protein n=1 Tax=Colletotrichum kahawae TaxID=34407 RepID=A0AAE0D0Z8_COLKA|nr:hypothetical protein CKAH01_08020 [Colletotrichum kahawae]